MSLLHAAWLAHHIANTPCTRAPTQPPLPQTTAAGASSWFFGAIQFPSVYSNPSAPGLLMGSGNVGGDGIGLDDNDGCAAAAVRARACARGGCMRAACVLACALACVFACALACVHVFERTEQTAVALFQGRPCAAAAAAEPGAARLAPSTRVPCRLDAMHTTIFIFFARRLCTWLSFDGGFSWSDVAEGTWIYEYADWGGLLVMAKHELSGPADEVRGWLAAALTDGHCGWRPRRLAPGWQPACASLRGSSDRTFPLTRTLLAMAAGRWARSLHARSSHAPATPLTSHDSLCRCASASTTGAAGAACRSRQRCTWRTSGEWHALRCMHDCAL